MKRVRAVAVAAVAAGVLIAYGAAASAVEAVPSITQADTGWNAVPVPTGDDPTTVVLLQDTGWN